MVTGVVMMLVVLVRWAKRGVAVMTLVVGMVSTVSGVGDGD